MEDAGGRQPAARSPWLYVPSLYFAEGVPYILINTVSVILYTRIGVDNATMAFWTSWLYLPWVIKMFWGPLVDLVGTKRGWIQGTQFALFAIFGYVALSLGWQSYFLASLAGFIVGAFISATHDIATDGYYMLALDKADQAFFVGIRSTFYRVAMIFGSGLLVFLAGKLEQLGPAGAAASVVAPAAAVAPAASAAASAAAVMTAEAGVSAVAAVSATAPAAASAAAVSAVAPGAASVSAVMTTEVATAFPVDTVLATAAGMAETVVATASAAAASLVPTTVPGTTAAAPDVYARVLLPVVTALGCEPGNRFQAWSIVFGTVGVLFLVLFLYHTLVLPRPEGDGTAGPAGTASGNGEQVSFGEAFRTFFTQDGIGRILAFILLYRFGEAMLVKLASPFLLADPAKGGLGLLTEEVGIAYGTIGLLSLLVGGVLGGMAIARFGFRKCIWPMAVAMNVPDAFYIYMAWARPAKVFVYPLVAIEQLGYGFGFTAFTVYLMYVCTGKYKTSHFAIATGIMALGMMLPGFVSGYLQEQLGYTMFFVVVCLATIPGFLTIPFLLRDPRIDENATPAAG